MNRFLTTSGADALEFLQGQLTQDLGQVTATDSLPSAWCNPKGRVLATMRVIAIDSGFGMILPEDICSTVLQRLSMYRFRANVEFAVSGSEWTSFAVQQRQAIELLQQLELLPLPGKSLTSRGMHALRPHSDDDFVELYGTTAALNAAGLDANRALTHEQWAAARIRAGIAVINSDNSERFTAHMLNLDRLGAVNFDKGCYTGQEIVARTENLGRSRRRMALYQATQPGIAVGDKLTIAGADAGDVVNVAGADLLAVVPTELHNRTLIVDNIDVTPAKLPYSL